MLLGVCQVQDMFVSRKDTRKQNLNQRSC